MLSSPTHVPPALISRDASARGLRTRVVETGTGPALVLIHGFLAHHHTFDDVIDPLSRSFHIICVDLPGFGESEKPPPTRFPYTVEAFAEVVTDVIAALEIGRSHVLGHALGAAVALTLAAEHPEFVDHLTLVAPEIYPSHLSLSARVLLAPLLGPILFKQALGRSLFRSLVQSRLYAAGHQPPSDRINSYYTAFNTPSARESAHAVMRSQLDTRPSIARLTRIKAPTLLVCGRADPDLPPPIASRIVRQLANAQLEFVDSGHSPHEEQPSAFVSIIERFLFDQRR